MTAAELASARVQLVCPKCGEMNRPGVLSIELEPTGLCVCSVCCHTWRAQPAR